MADTSAIKDRAFAVGVDVVVVPDADTGAVTAPGTEKSYYNVQQDRLGVHKEQPDAYLEKMPCDVCRREIGYEVRIIAERDGGERILEMRFYSGGRLENGQIRARGGRIKTHRQRYRA